MPSHSLGFAAFLAVVLLGTALTPTRWRWVALLVASYAFYASFGAFYLPAVLLLVTGISYGCGLAIARSESYRQKRYLLWLGISLSVLVLVVLKYTGFLVENLVALAHLAGVDTALDTRNPFVSVGVSFFVFQGISNLLDVYLETAPPERHLGFYALHMALFAKITQGPIERASDLLPQLRAPLTFSVANTAAGLRLLFWGLFQKVVVADRLALFVDAIYSDVHAYHGLPLVLVTYLFALQLYFDFSGYTDMARGTARLFGIHLVENFNYPYLAWNVAEFWRRWHMSFTHWILDYVFKPLQLSLRSLRTWGTPISLVITFLISGLWHGASWCFVVWGGLHGLCMATSVLSSRWRRRLAQRFGVDRSRWLRPFQVFVTFHLVCLAWVFFRAQTLSDAWHVVDASVTGLPMTLAQVVRGIDLDRLLWLGQRPGELVLALALLAFMSVVGVHRRRATETETEAEDARGGVIRLMASPWVRTAVAAVMCYFLAFHGASAQGFIYTQF
jgi:alginate O-acetyltransferase complex protein AlgI